MEGLYQDIPTEAGQAYLLSFRMKSQDPGRASMEDEGVNVSAVLSFESFDCPAHSWLLTCFFFSLSPYRLNGTAAR